MNWTQRYRLRLYLSNSIWLWPLIGIVAALLFAKLLHQIELSLHLHSTVGRDVSIAMFGIIAGSTFSMVVVFTSAILIAVQLASAQLTPRIIAMVYRSSARKFSLTVFVFTFTLSVAVMVRIGDTVPLLSSYVAAYIFLFNLSLFIHFVESMGKSLRPSSALQAVGRRGRVVIRNVYPRLLDEENVISQEPLILVDGNKVRTVINNQDGAVLAFDSKGLLNLAERHDCIIEVMPAVGDFVAAGDPLFKVFQGGDDIPDAQLQNSVALGPERTMEQDPMFGFRIMVDIASKALSPAINDPTTAVLAIDQMHYLLRDVGRRFLAEGQERDRAGRVRLVYRTPNWEDFVHLAVTEVRQYGRDSIQVMRRMHAMLENLIKTLPDRREPLLRKELDLLVTSSSRVFPDSEDQRLAQIGDPQGMGLGIRDTSRKRVDALDQNRATSR